MAEGIPLDIIEMTRLLPSLAIEDGLAIGVTDLQSKFVERGFRRAEGEGVRFVRLRQLTRALPRLRAEVVATTAAVRPHGTR